MPIPERPPRLPTKFWAAAEELVATSEIVIDRPKDSRHPQLPKVMLSRGLRVSQSTTAIDGEGIDVWVGSLEPMRITGVVCTFNLRKRDAEVKLLLGCTSEEENEILSFLNKGLMAAILVAKRVDDLDRDRSKTPRGPTPAPDERRRDNLAVLSYELPACRGQLRFHVQRPSVGRMAVSRVRAPRRNRGAQA